MWAQLDNMCDPINAIAPCPGLHVGTLTFCGSSWVLRGLRRGAAREGGAQPVAILEECRGPEPGVWSMPES